MTTTRAAMIEAVEREAHRYELIAVESDFTATQDMANAKALPLRAVAETLAVVEWVQRLNPAAWAREVTLYKRAQAELAAMDKQEGRGDG